MNHLIPVPFNYVSRGFINDDVARATGNGDSHAIVAMQPFNDTFPTVTLAVLARSLNPRLSNADYYAHLAVQTVVDSFIQANLEDETYENQVLDILNQSFMRTSQIIEARTREAGVYCLAAAIVDDRLYLANVGACRAFLLREAEVVQLTSVTPLEKLVVAGAVPSGGIAANRTFIDYVGQGDVIGQGDITPDFRLHLNNYETLDESLSNQGMPLYAGDTLVLCNSRFFAKSDPLYKNGLDIFSQCGDLHDATEQFLEFHSSINPNSELTVLALKIPE